MTILVKTPKSRAALMCEEPIASRRSGDGWM